MSVTLAGEELKLEIAATPEELAKGLSEREELPPGRGMLFVFAEPHKACFWMKDTWIPLDALFINRLGEIVKIATMTPQTLRRHCSDEAVLWVIELPAGWAKEHGLDKGDLIAAETLDQLHRVRDEL